MPATLVDDIGIVMNPAKTVVLPPKGHGPMAEDDSLVESVDVLVGGGGLLGGGERGI